MSIASGTGVIVHVTLSDVTSGHSPEQVRGN